MRSHLIHVATDRPFAPLGTAELHELLSKVIGRVLGEAIVDTRQLLAEDALLPALAPERTPSEFVLWCQRLCRDAGAQEQGGKARTQQGQTHGAYWPNGHQNACRDVLSSASSAEKSKGSDRSTRKNEVGCWAKLRGCMIASRPKSGRAQR